VKTLLAILLGAVIAWIGFDVTAEPEAPPAPEVVAAQQAADAQAQRDKVQKDWDDRVATHVGGTLSWCEPATGNRLYWTGNDWNVAVSQNDDSCPQPNPQPILPGKPA
jgi:hypothetical protein